MKVLLDACVPAPLRGRLVGHTVKTAQEMGWGALKNGELLTAAEAQFEVFITADKNLRYQQNLAGRRIALIVLPTNDWTVLRSMDAQVLAALSSLQPGGFAEILL